MERTLILKTFIIGEIGGLCNPKHRHWDKIGEITVTEIMMESVAEYCYGFALAVVNLMRG